jgi:DNA-binding transcriptional MerR regulator
MENLPKDELMFDERAVAIKSIAESALRYGISLDEIRDAIASAAETTDNDTRSTEETPDAAPESSDKEPTLQERAHQWVSQIRQQDVQLTGKFDKGLMQEEGRGRYDPNRKTETPGFAGFDTIQLSPDNEYHFNRHSAPFGRRLNTSTTELMRYFTLKEGAEIDVLLFAEQPNSDNRTPFVYATKMTDASSLDGRTGGDMVFMYGTLDSGDRVNFSQQVTKDPELMTEVFTQSFQWLVDGQWVERRPAQALAICGVNADINDHDQTTLTPEELASHAYFSEFKQ